MVLFDRAVFFYGVWEEVGCCKSVLVGCDPDPPKRPRAKPAKRESRLRQVSLPRARVCCFCGPSLGFLVSFPSRPFAQPPLETAVALAAGSIGGRSWCRHSVPRSGAKRCFYSRRGRHRREAQLLGVFLVLGEITNVDMTPAMSQNSKCSRDNLPLADQVEHQTSARPKAMPNKKRRPVPTGGQESHNSGAKRKQDYRMIP